MQASTAQASRCPRCPSQCIKAGTDRPSTRSRALHTPRRCRRACASRRSPTSSPAGPSPPASALRSQLRPLAPVPADPQGAHGGTHRPSPWCDMPPASCAAMLAALALHLVTRWLGTPPGCAAANPLKVIPPSPCRLTPAPLQAGAPWPPPPSPPPSAPRCTRASSRTASSRLRPR